MIRELFFSWRAIPTWIALTALFVALGGPAAAVDLVSGKKIDGKTIKKGTITGKQVKNASLGEGELTPEAVTALLAIPPDSVEGPSVKDGTLGGPDLGNNVLDGTKIIDGSLSGADVGRFSGALSLDFGTVPQLACKTVTTNVAPVAPGSEDLQDDAIIITPPAGFPRPPLDVGAQPAGSDAISVTACNPNNMAVVVGARTFHYVAIDTVGQ